MRKTTHKPKGRPRMYPQSVILRAQAMYLAGHSYKEIAEATRMPEDYIRRERNMGKWYALRQDPSARAEALAMVQKQLAEWNRTISLDTQSLSLDAVPVVRDAIARGSARDLKDSAAGLRTLVEVAKLTSGLADDDKTKPSSSISLFYFNEPVQRARPMVDVTPAQPVLEEAMFE